MKKLIDSDTKLNAENLKFVGGEMDMKWVCAMKIGRTFEQFKISNIQAHIEALVNATALNDKFELANDIGNREELAKLYAKRMNEENKRNDMGIGQDGFGIFSSTK